MLFHTYRITRRRPLTDTVAHMHQILRGHTSWNYGAEWSPDGKFLATSGADGSVRIWAMQPSGSAANATVVPEAVEVLRTHTLHVFGLAWTADR